MDWLDAAGTGAVTVPLLDPAAGGFTVRSGRRHQRQRSRSAGRSRSVRLGLHAGQLTGSGACRYTASRRPGLAGGVAGQGIVRPGAPHRHRQPGAGSGFATDGGRHTATLSLGNPVVGIDRDAGVRLEVVPDDGRPRSAWARTRSATTSTGGWRCRRPARWPGPCTTCAAAWCGARRAGGPGRTRSPGTAMTASGRRCPRARTCWRATRRAGIPRRRR